MKTVRFEYNSRGRGFIIAMVAGSLILVGCGYVLWLEDAELSVFAVCIGLLCVLRMAMSLFTYIRRHRIYGCEINDESIRWWDNVPQTVEGPDGGNGELKLADIVRVELTTAENKLQPLHIESADTVKHEVPAHVLYDDRRFAKAIAKRARHADVFIDGKTV